jgi:hypothetical protein
MMMNMPYMGFDWQDGRSPLTAPEVLWNGRKLDVKLNYVHCAISDYVNAYEAIVKLEIDGQAFSGKYQHSFSCKFVRDDHDELKNEAIQKAIAKMEKEIREHASNNAVKQQEVGLEILKSKRNIAQSLEGMLGEDNEE